MRKFALAAVVLAAAACGPSINPQMKSATDEMIASVKGGHDEAPPSSYEPMEWAEGQWVMTRMVNSKGEPTISRMGVVGREDGGFWIETETQDYYRHSISKVLYSKRPRTAEEAVDAMLKIVTKNDDQEAQVMDFTDPNNPALAFTKKLMKSTAEGIVIPAVEVQEKEDATVPAGTFRGCAKIPLKVTMGPISKDTVSWFHPAVPINGSVKGTSTDGEWTVELLDYGMTGATSKLQP